jgi:alpha-N-arabinofuranosidase
VRMEGRTIGLMGTFVVLALVTIALVPQLGAIGAGQSAQAPQAQASAPPVGIVPNPSFEAVDGNRPLGWRAATWQRSATFELASIGHTGARSAKISSTDGGDASWSAVIVVQPYAKYRLTGWIKTENLDPGTGRGALFNLHGLAGMETPALTGTHDWTEVSLEFDTTGIDAVQIDCLFGGFGRARGVAYFDDVRLEQLSVRMLEPAVTIDTASLRAPMSKYIYGQFIEHLGRCIYGGIWAEMLEDRKFYYAVGDKESPWKALRDGANVRMNKDQPFVGAETPEVTVKGGPGGIVQGDLALISGKAYTGRIVVAGDPQAAPIRVSLVWGDAPGARQTIAIPRIGPAFTTVPLAFKAGAATEAARLEIVGTGTGTFRVGTVSLMPADNVEGFRPDVLALLRELNAPVYRWPGGNFVSGYNWRDGIGDRDRRPPRKNPAWRGVEHNDVGIHEFMALCRLIGTEPYVSVNSGLGNAQSAAEEVEYINGAASTAMGRLRAGNGHPAPFVCRWWSIGNEMYGNWQLGHVPLSEYVKRHQEFAHAMREKDPTIQLVGVGSVGDWDDAMLRENSKDMNLLSEHFYCQESPGLMSHVAQVPRQVRRIADAMRRYQKDIPGVADANIRVALDEWNYWYGPHLYGELGTRYFLKDALGIAAGLHEYSRQSDVIFMANYAQTVNVIGAIKTTKTAAAFDTTGLVLKLYRAHFGTVPVAVTGAPEPLDVVAAWTSPASPSSGSAARRALTISVINPTASEQVLAIDVKGITLPATARLWRIAGTDPMAYNEPGKPPSVVIQEMAAVPVSKALRVPPMSISLFELPGGATASRPSGSR